MPQLNPNYFNRGNITSRRRQQLTNPRNNPIPAQQQETAEANAIHQEESALARACREREQQDYVRDGELLAQYEREIRDKQDRKYMIKHLMDTTLHGADREIYNAEYNQLGIEISHLKRMVRTIHDRRRNRAAQMAARNTIIDEMTDVHIGQINNVRGGGGGVGRLVNYGNYGNAGYITTSNIPTVTTATTATITIPHGEQVLYSGSIQGFTVGDYSNIPMYEDVIKYFKEVYAIKHINYKWTLHSVDVIFKDRYDSPHGCKEDMYIVYVNNIDSDGYHIGTGHYIFPQDDVNKYNKGIKPHYKTLCNCPTY